MGARRHRERCGRPDVRCLNEQVGGVYDKQAEGLGEEPGGRHG